MAIDRVSSSSTRQIHQQQAAADPAKTAAKPETQAVQDKAARGVYDQADQFALHGAEMAVNPLRDVQAAPANALDGGDPAQQAQQLIDKHTSWFNLDEQALGQELAAMAVQDPAGSHAVINEVFQQLSGSWLVGDNKQQVARSFIDSFNDEQLAQLAAGPDGQNILQTADDMINRGGLRGDEVNQSQRIGQAVADAAASPPVETLPAEPPPAEIPPAEIPPVEVPPGEPPLVDPPPLETPATDAPEGPLVPGQEYSADVEELQQKLVDLGYMDPQQIGSYWGYYGPYTEGAVRQFQTDHGLPASGVANQTTLDTIWGGEPSEAAWPAGPLALDAGAYSQDVETMQNRMVELGYMDAQDIGQFWGHYGPRTEAAVRSFQRANGISPANGVADGATLAAMASPEAVDAATYRANMPAEVIGPVVGASADGVVPTATAMTADDQARVQQRLTDLGYLVNRDAMDAESIRNYQIMNSLPGTGELDQATLNSMWSADAKISTHIVQFHEDRYNPTKSGGGSNNCGPASVAMALAATGLVEIDNQDPQALVADMRADSGTEAPNYTGPADLYTAAEANGAAPYYVNSMDDVDTALANGDPVVLFGVPNQDGTYYAGHDMGSISPPPAEGQEDHSHHWITVLGYDPKTDTYTISDPLSRDGVITCARSELETYADFSISSVAVHNPQ